MPYAVEAGPGHMSGLGLPPLKNMAPHEKISRMASAPIADGWRVKNNYFTEMSSGSEAGSHSRFIDLCITEL